MNINLSSIMGKIETFSKSAEGKKKMRECVGRYQKDGRSTTAAGGEIVTEKMMLEAANKFIDVLGATAAKYDLPESVMKHIDSMRPSGGITKTSGGVEMRLNFGGNLHRDSLENDLGYDGIDNIVALLNNGYHTKNYVYGWWNGHRATGDGVLRSGVGSDFAWVRSRKEREPLRFIQQAVADFNAHYGAEYGVTAVAGVAYE